jgi:hypothetical protein
MKKTMFLLLSMISLIFMSCATREESCLQDCGNISLKSQNKCAIEHAVGGSDNFECSKVASQETNKCVGKCYGNL